MRATVTTPSGERFQGVTGDLLAYYLSEAETVPGYEIDENEAEVVASFPRIFDGEAYVDVASSGPVVELESVEAPPTVDEVTPTDPPAEPDLADAPPA